jgi:signal transduction histidine kinase
VNVEIPSLVYGLTELFQQSVGPTVQIETRFPLGLPYARVDLNQVELALLNLVRNARDAMPEGATITIAARQETVAPGHHTGLRPGQYLCLTVSDTGEGMDHTTLTRAMEPFFTTKGWQLLQDDVTSVT